MCPVMQIIKSPKFKFGIQSHQMFIKQLMWTQQCFRIMNTQLFPGPEKFAICLLVYSFIFVHQSLSANTWRLTAIVPDELFLCWWKKTCWSVKSESEYLCSMENGVGNSKHLPLNRGLHSKVEVSLQPVQWRALCFAESLDIKLWASQKQKWNRQVALIE